jgi:adenylosuccinate lyase
VALKHGIGRERAHAIIKKHAVAEALRLREEGARENNLIMLLSEDPELQEAGITYEELQETLIDRSTFIGNARRQIDAVRGKVEPFIEKYQEHADYEPKEIL